MLASMASFTLPNPALVRTVRLRRPAAQLLRSVAGGVVVDGTWIDRVSLALPGWP